MRYVASLVSGVGIFCVGAGLSVYHGITGIYNPDPIGSFYWVDIETQLNAKLFILLRLFNLIS